MRSNLCTKSACQTGLGMHDKAAYLCSPSRVSPFDARLCLCSSRASWVMCVLMCGCNSCVGALHACVLTLLWPSQCPSFPGPYRNSIVLACSRGPAGRLYRGGHDGQYTLRTPRGPLGVGVWSLEGQACWHGAQSRCAEHRRACSAQLGGHQAVVDVVACCLETAGSCWGDPDRQHIHTGCWLATSSVCVCQAGSRSS